MASTTAHGASTLSVAEVAKKQLQTLLPFTYVPSKAARESQTTSSAAHHRESESSVDSSGSERHDLIREGLVMQQPFFLASEVSIASSKNADGTDNTLGMSSLKAMPVPSTEIMLSPMRVRFSTKENTIPLIYPPLNADELSKLARIQAALQEAVRKEGLMIDTEVTNGGLSITVPIESTPATVPKIEIPARPPQPSILKGSVEFCNQPLPTLPPTQPFYHLAQAAAEANLAFEHHRFSYASSTALSGSTNESAQNLPLPQSLVNGIAQVLAISDVADSGTEHWSTAADSGRGTPDGELITVGLQIPLLDYRASTFTEKLCHDGKEDHVQDEVAMVNSTLSSQTSRYPQISRPTNAVTTYEHMAHLVPIKQAQVAFKGQMCTAIRPPLALNPHSREIVLHHDPLEGPDIVFTPPHPEGSLVYGSDRKIGLPFKQAVYYRGTLVPVKTARDEDVAARKYLAAAAKFDREPPCSPYAQLRIAKGFAELDYKRGATVNDFEADLKADLETDFKTELRSDRERIIWMRGYEIGKARTLRRETRRISRVSGVLFPGQ